MFNEMGNAEKEVMRLASSERRTKKNARAAHEISQAVWRGCAKVSLLTRRQWFAVKATKINLWRPSCRARPGFSFERSGL